MKVFISWSGDPSREIALKIYEWLPAVIQSVTPYMSSESIDKGARWATSIASELEGSSIGLVILTPDNITAPWILFESGALAKVVGESKLAPILCGLKPSDVGTPLSQFQVTAFDKFDMLRLLKSINSSLDTTALPESRLERAHNAHWPGLQSEVDPIIESINAKNHTAREKNPDKESSILEEILVLLRQQSQVILNPERLFPPGLLESTFDNVTTLYTSRLRHYDRQIKASCLEIRQILSKLNELLLKDSNDGRITDFQIVRKHFDIIDSIINRLDNLQRTGDDKGYFYKTAKNLYRFNKILDREEPPYAPKAD